MFTKLKLIKLYSTYYNQEMPFLKHFTIITSQLRHYQLCHSFMRGSCLLPSQLPGEHTCHKAASMHAELTWNAHYSSTHHQCGYSLYLPTKGWKTESTPSQVESRVGIEPRTCHMMVHCSTYQAILAHELYPSVHIDYISI